VRRGRKVLTSYSKVKLPDESAPLVQSDFRKQWLTQEIIDFTPTSCIRHEKGGLFIYLPDELVTTDWRKCDKEEVLIKRIEFFMRFIVPL